MKLGEMIAPACATHARTAVHAEEVYASGA